MTLLFAVVLIVGMFAKTLFKGALAILLGTGRFRRLVAGGFLAYALAFALGWFLI